jgi:hypothetical protein
MKPRSKVSVAAFFSNSYTDTDEGDGSGWFYSIFIPSPLRKKKTSQIVASRGFIIESQKTQIKRQLFSFESI